MPRQGKKKPTGKVTVPTLVDRALKADWDSARAIITAVGHKEAVDFDRKQLLPHGEPWKPYRTVASWYLWRVADGR